MNLKPYLAGCLSLALVASAAGGAGAHGLAGKRFFPATLVVDDPFVADELSLPSVSHIKQPAGEEQPATRVTSVSGELSKRITPDLGLSLEGEWLHLARAGGQDHSGFGNLELAVKYQLVKSDPHESVLSAGLGLEVGGTGQAPVGAESFDVLKPALFFGKGLGDLPDSLAYLRPLAITGSVGGEIPARGSTRKIKLGQEEGEIEVERERHPDVFTWGLAIEYSIPYLQSFVRDVGLPAPLGRMIPLVEIEFQHPLNRGESGRYTGTVNPGVIWAGRFFQVAVEAIVPVNARTGKNLGIRGQLHFYLDDLFPTTIGRPLFGGR
ncbi:MAG TPA: hypothetical protein VLK28_11245 [Methylomirabilota bacterium]|nr:hypothetical protein [Methylomirabilota bacterium]